MKRWICFIGLLALSSCGQDKFPDYEHEKKTIEVSTLDQYFKAKFKPLNNRLSKLKKADAMLWLKLRQFYVKIIFWGSGQRRYIQFIHVGSSCPGYQSDVNGDGWIDFNEVILFAGEVFIPLDRNLQTRSSGNEWFPHSSKKGSYLYSRASSLLKMLPDLGLNSVHSLNLSERVIVIYTSLEGALVPIACAEISRD